MANSIDFRGSDHRIQRLSAKKTLAKNRKRGTLDEVRWINLFSGGQNDKFAASKLLPDSNIFLCFFLCIHLLCVKRSLSALNSSRFNQHSKIVLHYRSSKPPSTPSTPTPEKPNNKHSGWLIPQSVGLSLQTQHLLTQSSEREIIDHVIQCSPYWEIPMPNAILLEEWSQLSSFED